MALITDRFRNLVTGERSHVDYFRVMQRMRLARNRREESIFEFDGLFLQSLRAGYLKRLDFDFCLWLGSARLVMVSFTYMRSEADCVWGITAQRASTRWRGKLRSQHVRGNALIS